MAQVNLVFIGGSSFWAGLPRLFGGNAQEIIPIGYGTGAFHLASFLAHKEFQELLDKTEK